MLKRVNVQQLSVLAAVALIAASVTAIATNRRASPQHDHACLAIGQGVCLSGTTEWVAQAAERSLYQSTITLAMAGDAF